MDTTPHDNDLNILRQTLVEARTDRGISQAAAARLMGVTQPVVSQIESGESEPRLSTLARYAAALGLRLSWSLDDDAARTPHLLITRAGSSVLFPLPSQVSVCAGTAVRATFLAELVGDLLDSGYDVVLLDLYANFRPSSVWSQAMHKATARSLPYRVCESADFVADLGLTLVEAGDPTADITKLVGVFGTTPATTSMNMVVLVDGAELLRESARELTLLAETCRAVVAGCDDVDERTVGHSLLGAQSAAVLVLDAAPAKAALELASEVSGVARPSVTAQATQLQDNEALLATAEGLEVVQVRRPGLDDLVEIAPPREPDGTPGFALGTDRRGQPVYVSEAELKQHSLVFGATGYGKSETLKTLTGGLLDLGSSALILDLAADDQPNSLRDWASTYARSNKLPYHEFVLANTNQWFNPLAGLDADAAADVVLSLVVGDPAYASALVGRLVRQALRLLVAAHAANPDLFGAPSLAGLAALLAAPTRKGEDHKKLVAAVMATQPDATEEDFAAVMHRSPADRQIALDVLARLDSVLTSDPGRALRGLPGEPFALDMSGLNYIGLDAAGRSDETRLASSSVLCQLRARAPHRTGAAARPQPMVVAINNAAAADEKLVTELLSVARAAGISLVLASQSPRDWGKGLDRLVQNTNVVVGMGQNDLPNARWLGEFFDVQPASLRSLNMGEAVVRIARPSRNTWLQVRGHDPRRVQTQVAAQASVGTTSQALTAATGSSVLGTATSMMGNLVVGEHTANVQSVSLTSRATSQRLGRVITVASPKGGVGKTGMALALGTYLGQRLRSAGKNVCVIDANFQQADIGKLLNSFEPNITQLAKHAESVNPADITQYLHFRQDLNCAFLLGPAHLVDANPVWVTPKLYKNIVTVLRQLFDYIVIDTPTAEMYTPILREFALPEADYLLVPTIARPSTLSRTAEWLRDVVIAPRHAGGLDIDPHRIGIVLCTYPSAVARDERMVKSKLSDWMYLGAMPEPETTHDSSDLEEMILPATANEAYDRILFRVTGEPVFRNVTSDEQSA